MTASVTMLCLCLLGFVVICQAYQPLIMTTLLDHYNGDNTTFNLRYWRNADYYIPGNPVFLYISGPETANPHKIFDHNSPLNMYVREFKGILFMLEHRFFGQSIPNGRPDISKLHTKQVLGDIQKFIQAKRALTNIVDKIVVIGDSFSGHLAVWSRLHGEAVSPSVVVASGANIVAKLEFPEMYAAVKQNIERASKPCAQSVANGFALIQEKIKTVEGRDELQRAFSMCELLLVNSKALFWTILYTPYREAVEIDGAEGKPIIQQRICAIHNTDEDVLVKMIKVHNEWRQRNLHKTCSTINIERDRSQLRSSKFGTELGDEKAKFWMQCNEYGGFMTTSSSGNFFGDANNVPLSYFVQKCQALFGKKYDGRFIANQVENMNMATGARNKPPRKLILVSGSNDPYISLQMSTSHPVLSIHTIVIQGVGHCVDTYPIRPTENPQLRGVRREIIATLKQFFNLR